MRKANCYPVNSLTFADLQRTPAQWKRRKLNRRIQRAKLRGNKDLAQRLTFERDAVGATA